LIITHLALEIITHVVIAIPMTYRRKETGFVEAENG